MFAPTKLGNLHHSRSPPTEQHCTQTHCTSLRFHRASKETGGTCRFAFARGDIPDYSFARNSAGRCICERGGGSTRQDGRLATSDSASKRQGRSILKPAAAPSPQKGPGVSKQKQEPGGQAKKESAFAPTEKSHSKYEGGDDPKFIEAIERDILATKLGTKWGQYEHIEPSY